MESQVQHEVVSDSLDKQIKLIRALRNIFAALIIALVIISHPPCPCALFGLPFFTTTGIVWWLLQRQYKKLLKIKEGEDTEDALDEEIATSVMTRRGLSA